MDYYLFSRFLNARNNRQTEEKKTIALVKVSRFFYASPTFFSLKKVLNK